MSVEFQQVGRTFPIKSLSVCQTACGKLHGQVLLGSRPWLRFNTSFLQFDTLPWNFGWWGTHQAKVVCSASPISPAEACNSFRLLTGFCVLSDYSPLTVSLWGRSAPGRLKHVLYSFDFFMMGMPRALDKSFCIYTDLSIFFSKLN